MWGILLALMVTTIVLVLRPPLYRSDATVFVRTPGDVSRVDDGGDSYARARAGTYAVLIKSTSISSRVIANLGLDLKPETLSNRISAGHADGTALINIGVSAPSPDEAQRTATVLIAEFTATVRSLESVPGSLVPRAEIVVVDPPGEPGRVLAWGAPLYLVVLGAVLVGLVLGALGAVLRSILAAEVEPEDLQELVDPAPPVDKVPEIVADVSGDSDDVPVTPWEGVESSNAVADEVDPVNDVGVVHDVDVRPAKRTGRPSRGRGRRRPVLTEANGRPNEP